MGVITSYPSFLPMDNSQMGNMLSRVTTGRIKMPDRILMHGLDGLGKSTFGSQAPRPIFLGPEKGTGNLDVARLPPVTRLNEVFAAVTELTNEPHDFQTLVIDSWDWIEPLVWQHVCVEEGASNIEQVGGGFGKGYTSAIRYWRNLLAMIDVLQEKRSMNVIGICHSELKTVNNPMTNSAYDRYIIKMNQKASAFLREWSDIVFFASKKVITRGRPNQKHQAMSDGTSYMYCKWMPAYDAKTRYAIDEEMPLSYGAYRKAMNATDEEKIAVMKSEILDLIKVCPDEELKAKAETFMAEQSGNLLALTKLNDRLRELVFEKEKTNV